MTTDLAAWLFRQLDDDERVARSAFLRTQPGSERWVANFDQGMQVWTEAGGFGGSRPGTLVVKHSWPNEIEHICRWDPARVLAEVAAKRAIVELASYPHDWRDWNPVVRESVLMHHALPYADWPGYREEWRPA